MARLQYQITTKPVFIPAEIVTVDKWYQGFLEPVRVKPGLNAALQPFNAYFETAQFPETVTESRWHYPWSEPVRLKRGIGSWQQPFAINPSFPPVVSFSWIYGLSEPVRIKPGLRKELQQFYTGDTVFNKGEGVVAWYQRLAEPVRIKLGLNAGLQQFYTANIYPLPPPLTLEQSWEPWSEPLHAKPGLNAALQQFFTYPPRVLPAPNVTLTMSALENSDDAEFALYVYTSSVIDLSAVRVSIEEIYPDRGVVTSIVET